MSPHPCIGHDPCHHIITAICHISILLLVKGAIIAKLVKFARYIHLEKSVGSSFCIESHGHPHFFHFIFVPAVAFTHHDRTKAVTFLSQHFDHATTSRQMGSTYTNEKGGFAF